MTPAVTPDPAHSVDHLLQHAYRIAAAGALDLSRRGITPTLGVHTLNEDEHASGFLSRLHQDAADAGVLIKHLDTHGTARENPTMAALADLPDTWDLDTSRLAVAAHALREFQRSRSTTVAIRSHGAVGLASWLLHQRLAQVRDGAELLVEDPTVHGVICPPPLPRGLTARDHIAQIVPEQKDVDGVHPGTLRRLLPGVEFPDDVVLTAAGCDAAAGWQTRRIASAMLIVATVAAAQRQHPRSLPHSEAAQPGA